MKIHKRPFIGLILLSFVFMFISSSVYAAKKLKTRGLPKFPIYKKKDGAYLYFATSPPACVDTNNEVTIDGAKPSFSYSWWIMRWCDHYPYGTHRGTIADRERLVLGAPTVLPPGRHKFQLQSTSTRQRDSFVAMTRILKFKQTFAPGEFWVLFTQFTPDGKFGYVLMKLGKCGSVKRFEAPPKSNRQDHNRYLTLSIITRNIKTYRCGVNGAR